MTRLDRIRTLNDRLRRTGQGGMIVITAGVAALQICETEVARALAAFDQFDEDNDPYGEHDFGALDLAGERLFWKIDYYDPSLVEGSVDAADEAHTERVLTLMLASEY